MDKYYIPIDQDDEWIIYEKVYSPKIGEDIYGCYKDMYIRARVEDLEYMFKDDDKIIKDIEKGIYPPFKVDEKDKTVNVDNFLKIDGSWGR